MLGHIWQLSDQDKDGRFFVSSLKLSVCLSPLLDTPSHAPLRHRLSQEEFKVAMHMVMRIRTKQATLPAELPRSLDLNAQRGATTTAAPTDMTAATPPQLQSLSQDLAPQLETPPQVDSDDPFADINVGGEPAPSLAQPELALSGGPSDQLDALTVDALDSNANAGFGNDLLDLGSGSFDLLGGVSTDTNSGSGAAADAVASAPPVSVAAELTEEELLAPIPEGGTVQDSIEKYRLRAQDFERQHVSASALGSAVLCRVPFSAPTVAAQPSTNLHFSLPSSACTRKASRALRLTAKL